MLRAILLATAVLFPGCGGDDDASGDFAADVSVNGETSALSSGCTLAETADIDGYAIEAVDRDSDSGIYGVGLAWPAAAVTGPGTHDLTSTGVVGLIIRPSADGSGLTYSSVSEGSVTFDEYDPDSRVAGSVTDVLMMRDDPDDTITVEITEATFVCE